MGRIYQAFKRAERGGQEPRANSSLARDRASESRVGGANRSPQSNDGFAQHLDNAEMLERLTSREEDHYAEHLMRERASEQQPTRRASAPLARDAQSEDERVVPFVARHGETPSHPKNNGAAHPSNLRSHGANGVTQPTDYGSRGMNRAMPSFDDEGSAFAPPVPTNDEAREERRRRIAEALQASRPDLASAPMARADAENGANRAGSANARVASSEELYTMPGDELPSRAFDSSRFQSPPERAVESSASTERIEENSADGLALSVAETSRVAGATVDVDGATRVAQELSEAQVMEVSPTRVEPHLVAIIEPHSPHAERFRALRTRVLQAGEKRGMKSFVITSANPSEGKTLTALNLAWLLAQAEGVRALLIDGDLRRPCLADYLDIEPQFGLSDVLAGDCKLKEAIVNLQPAGLYLLSGGESEMAREQVADLFSGPTFNKVLQEAREMFDYIIIDAPPLGVFTDASLLMNRADGALLVVRAGKTRYAALDRLLEPLPRERILGVVLNGSDEPVNEGNYYYYKRREEKNEK